MESHTEFRWHVLFSSWWPRKYEPLVLRSLLRWNTNLNLLADSNAMNTINPRRECSSKWEKTTQPKVRLPTRILKSKRMFPIVYLFLIVTTVVASPPSWPNSATDVHTFLTFDDGLNTSQITATAPYIDFVWGGHAPDVWRTSNPSTIISYYVPYNRDPTASHTLDWWKAFQPS